MRFIDRLFGRKAGEPKHVAPPVGQGQATPSTPGNSGGLPKCPGNPGRAVDGTIAFENGERSWTEAFHLIPLAAGVLRARGHQFLEHGTWLELQPSGFILQPLLVHVEPLEKGGVHTLTTIDVRHPDLIKDGLFEYQHSTGDNLAESLTKGFESWESVDLPVLFDALRVKPETCSLWVMNFPEKDGVPPRERRAVLGGVAYLQRHPSKANPHGEKVQGECEHAFCNCCFLTRNYEAFRSQIEGSGYFGIRFYAMRDEDGTPGADCRINGEDYPPGMEALRAYVASWPGEGFEFRKQYVFLHTPAVTES